MGALLAYYSVGGVPLSQSRGLTIGRQKFARGDADGLIVKLFWKLRRQAFDLVKTGESPLCDTFKRDQAKHLLLVPALL